MVYVEIRMSKILTWVAKNPQKRAVLAEEMRRESEREMGGSVGVWDDIIQNVG